MASDRGMVSGGLTRRALVFAAPSLLVPTVVLPAVAPTPGSAEELRGLLALMVLAVCGKLFFDLLVTPDDLYSLGVGQ